MSKNNITIDGTTVQQINIQSDKVKVIGINNTAIWNNFTQYNISDILPIINDNKNLLSGSLKTICPIKIKNDAIYGSVFFGINITELLDNSGGSDYYTVKWRLPNLTIELQFDIILSGARYLSFANIKYKLNENNNWTTVNTANNWYWSNSTANLICVIFYVDENFIPQCKVWIIDVTFSSNNFTSVAKRDDITIFNLTNNKVNFPLQTYYNANTFTDNGQGTRLDIVHEKAQSYDVMAKTFYIKLN